MWDVIIVGGGPAGMTAGLYAARAGLKTLLLEGELIGGQVSTTNILENYPGFPEPIGGPELMMRFSEQAERAGLTIDYRLVTRFELDGPVKRLYSGDDLLEARSVILTMGARRRKLGLENEDALVGRGISYCATCDGAFYRGKEVAVVGGGETAVEDALYLAAQSKVTLIHRRDSLRSAGIGAQRVMENPNIRILWNTRVTAAQPTSNGLTLSLAHTDGQAQPPLNVAGCFVAVGTQPGSELLKGQVELDDAGYVMASEDTQTSVPGVFAAGDLRKKPLKQVVTAVSDGAVAASMALNWLRKY
jgi:thioredoxin reductase (NADPH)